MGQFTNVKILGTGAGAEARTVTGGSENISFNQLNILNLGNFWVHSLSGQIPLAALQTSASAGTLSAAVGSTTGKTIIGAHGTHSASGQALTASAFLTVQTDTGILLAIPVLLVS